ncbi:acyltransferase domain-containing protein [Streptomyces sp. RB110-1]|uniref:acyltransferase domain-containing protein n=1 Tax=unclassified Streptomyces TaxID=2593676 RepID=UPI0019018131|nr:MULTISPECIES: acyltransferase domain-containing protein [unclassified Streptomyces]MBK0373082.1 acyltransferase domain-containing protein [Streptomyces sp. RB110-1]MBK0390550.1 acyltransferase domain-containing protein [Streptomyces sp. RB110-2]
MARETFIMEPVLMFPGQGAYFGGAVRTLCETYPEAQSLFTLIDETGASVGEPPVRPALTDPSDPSPEAMAADAIEALHLAVYGVPVFHFQYLERHGVTPSLLIGHSQGEISALTCAGAFSAADGARIVHLRNAVLRSWARPGGMTALGVSVAQAEAIVAAAGDPALAVACHNAPRQTVVAGPHAGLKRVHAVAEALDIWSRPLRLPFAVHCRQMADVAGPFRESLAGIVQHPLRHAVYSPIEGRFYRDDDDLLSCIVGHLLRPVRWLEALRDLHAGGADTFVQLGAKDSLTRTVSETLPQVTVSGCYGSRIAREELTAVAQRFGTTTTPLPPAPAPAAAPEPARPVRSQAPQPPQAPAPPAEREAEPDGADADPRAVVLAELRAFYAEALEYPQDVLEEAADLEADLGVDSVKQAELVSRVVEHWGLPPLADDYRVSDYITLGQVADLVLAGRD